MQKIHPGQGVVSSFGIGPSSESIIVNKQRMVFTIVTAFFIVFMAAAALNFVNQRFLVAGVVDSINEPSAYQPGQFVSNEIFRGYASK